MAKGRKGRREKKCWRDGTWYNETNCSSDDKNRAKSRCDESNCSTNKKKESGWKEGEVEIERRAWTWCDETNYSRKDRKESWDLV